MNNQDYDQKKRECFVQFCKDNGIDQEVNISIFDAFDQIFDRAYALGKKFGISDFSDAEGEEMLTVKRSDVINEFDKLHKLSYKAADLQLGLNAFRTLFGSKCLPDELNEDNFAKSEPKPSEPKNEGTRQKQCVPKNAESGTHSFNHILKDGFREHNRLHIAAMAMQGILSNIDLFKNVLETETETLSGDSFSYQAVAKASLLFADALIAEERS